MGRRTRRRLVPRYPIRFRHLRFHRADRHVNADRRTIEGNLELPSPVRRILVNDCGDIHVTGNPLPMSPVLWDPPRWNFGDRENVVPARRNMHPPSPLTWLRGPAGDGGKQFWVFDIEDAIFSLVSLQLCLGSPQSHAGSNYARRPSPPATRRASARGARIATSQVSAQQRRWRLGVPTAESNPMR